MPRFASFIYYILPRFSNYLNFAEFIFNYVLNPNFLNPQSFKIRPCKTRLGASTFFSCIPFTLSYINVDSLLEHANMPPTDRVMDDSCIETLFGLK